MGPPSDRFLLLLYGAPLRSVSSLTIGGPPLINFSLTMWGPLLVSSHTIWGPPQVSIFAYYKGPPQISFFAYYMGGGGGPSDQFLCILYGGPLRPVSSHTIWGPPQISFFPLNFFKILKHNPLNYPWGVPHIFEFPGGGAGAPFCAPPPLRAPMPISY